jgi:hypothetical protein
VKCKTRDMKNIANTAEFWLFYVRNTYIRGY